jgi:hypothetical protein
MLRILPILILTSLVLAYAVAENLWTERWHTGPEPGPEQLAQVPKTIGPWEDIEDKQLDAREIRVAELHGYLSRRYFNSLTGETLTVLLVFGQPGPIAVHSPQVCFGGAGFAPVEKRIHFTLEGGQAASSDFWSEKFQRPDAAIPEQFHVYYGWNTGAGWHAVEQPRLAYPWAHRLYKLYVARTLTRMDEPGTEDPIPDFLKLFTPELDRCLFQNP